MTLDGETLKLPLKQPFEAIQKAHRLIWCRIPELFGAHLEAINGIAQDLAISTDYLGSSLEEELLNE